MEAMSGRVPVVQVGQGDYVRTWPAVSAIRAIAIEVIERCQRGEPVSNRDAETLAMAILNGANVGPTKRQQGDVSCQPLNNS